MSTYPIAVQTTGSAGSAVGTGVKNVPYPTRVLAIELDYNGAPATTDVTVTNGGRTLLSVPNSNTDAVYEVRVPAVDSDGEPVDPAWYVEPFVRGAVTVQVAGADALSPAVTVRLLTE